MTDCPQVPPVTRLAILHARVIVLTVSTEARVYSTLIVVRVSCVVHVQSEDVYAGDMWAPVRSDHATTGQTQEQRYWTSNDHDNIQYSS